MGADDVKPGPASLDVLLSPHGAGQPDAAFFGPFAESVADSLPAESRNDLHALLRDFRNWDGIVDRHEDRLPLQRPRMVASCQHVRAAAPVLALRRWCVNATAHAAALYRMRWWLETVVAFFEVRCRWGTGNQTDA